MHQGSHSYSVNLYNCIPFKVHCKQLSPAWTSSNMSQGIYVVDITYWSNADFDGPWAETSLPLYPQTKEKYPHSPELLNLTLYLKDRIFLCLWHEFFFIMFRRNFRRCTINYEHGLTEGMRDPILNNFLGTFQKKLIILSTGLWWNVFWQLHFSYLQTEVTVTTSSLSLITLLMAVPSVLKKTSFILVITQMEN